MRFKMDLEGVIAGKLSDRNGSAFQANGPKTAWQNLPPEDQNSWLSHHGLGKHHMHAGISHSVSRSCVCYRFLPWRCRSIGYIIHFSRICPSRFIFIKSWPQREHGKWEAEVFSVVSAIWYCFSVTCLISPWHYCTQPTRHVLFQMYSRMSCLDIVSFPRAFLK